MEQNVEREHAQRAAGELVEEIVPGADWADTSCPTNQWLGTDGVANQPTQETHQQENINPDTAQTKDADRDADFLPDNPEAMPLRPGLAKIANPLREK